KSNETAAQNDTEEMSRRMMGRVVAVPSAQNKWQSALASALVVRHAHGMRSPAERCVWTADAIAANAADATTAMSPRSQRPLSVRTARNAKTTIAYVPASGRPTSSALLLFPA